MEPVPGVDWATSNKFGRALARVLSKQALLHNSLLGFTS